MATQATVPCPEHFHGGLYSCWKCEQDIPIGSPAGRNQHGVFHHATCPGPSRTVATPPGAAGAPAHYPARPPSAGADIGDQVVAELQRRRKGLPTDELAAADYLLGEIQFRRDAGLPPPKRPAPAAGPGDLGDQVVAILQQRHGQAGAA